VDASVYSLAAFSENLIEPVACRAQVAGLCWFVWGWMV